MRRGVKFLFAIFFVFIVDLFVGMIFDRYIATEWYQSLKMPSWAFGEEFVPVLWTVVYLLIGISIWLVWAHHAKAYIYTLFWLQIIFNILWPIAFFVVQDLYLAMVTIVILWVLVLVNLIAYWRFSKIASLLFVPYFAWTTYVLCLNFALL